LVQQDYWVTKSCRVSPTTTTTTPNHHKTILKINLVNEILLLEEGRPASENDQRGESMWNPGFLSKVSHQQQ
jgi:hypothetical protein